MRETDLAIFDWPLIKHEPTGYIDGLKHRTPWAKVIALCSGYERDEAIAAGCDNGADQVHIAKSRNWIVDLCTAAKNVLKWTTH